MERGIHSALTLNSPALPQFLSQRCVGDMRRTEVRSLGFGFRRVDRKERYGSTVMARSNGAVLLIADSNVMRATSRSGCGFS